MLDAGNTAIKKDRVLEEGLVQWGETDTGYTILTIARKGAFSRC